MCLGCISETRFGGCCIVRRREIRFFLFSETPVPSNDLARSDGSVPELGIQNGAVVALWNESWRKENVKAGDALTSDWCAIIRDRRIDHRAALGAPATTQFQPTRSAAYETIASHQRHRPDLLVQNFHSIQSTIELDRYPRASFAWFVSSTWKTRTRVLNYFTTEPKSN